MYATGYENWPVASVEYLQTIKDYIESNLQITYAYVGVVPPGSPESATLKAEVKFSVLSQGPAVKSYLSALNVPNPQGFLQALHSDLVSTVRISTPGYTAPPAIAIYPLVAQVDTSTLRKASSMEECWKIYSDAIVKTVLSITTSPIATKSPAGSGTSTFIKAV